jgi:branched-subunit amino acid ABC-type transport system permease component
VQLFLNTLITASTIILAAVSFRLVYTTARFFHFAHAATIPFGAYVTWLLLQRQVPLLPAAGFAVITAGAAGAAVFFLLLRPLINRSATPLILLLASLAIQIVIQHTLAIAFSDDARCLAGDGSAATFMVGTGHLTITQAWLIVAGVVVPMLLWLLSRYTLFGKKQQAVAEHRELSAIFGIDAVKVDLIVFALASAIGGLLGMFVGLDLAFSPQMGFSWLLPGVVAVIVGGIWRLERVLAACLVLAVLKTTTIWVLGGEYQDILIYGALFVYFIVMPAGLFTASESA